MVVKAGFAAAGEHIAVVEQVQLRGKAVLLIGAVKIRGRGEFTGQGNCVVHSADGIGEAAEQRKLQLQIVLVHNLLAFVQRVGLHGHGDHLGKAVGNGDHIVPRLAAGDPGQTDDGQGAGLVGGGGGAVDGDIGRRAGQRVGQVLIDGFQMEVQRQAHQSLAVHIDGRRIVQPGCRAGSLRPQGQKQNRKKQHEKHTLDPFQRRYLLFSGNLCSNRQARAKKIRFPAADGLFRGSICIILFILP